MRKLYLYPIIVMLFAGCTKKISIEPVYTGDTDWAPTITLTGNNYQRVGIEIEPPPRLELDRNLEQLLIEIQKAGGPGYASIDSFDFRYWGWTYSIWKVTEPIFDQNTQYSLRGVVKYRNEIERVSDAISFQTPIVNGNILKRIPVPDLPEFDSWLSSEFDFGNGFIYSLYSDGVLTKTDTSTGAAEVVTRLGPLNDRFFYEYENLSVYGESAFVVQFPENDIGYAHLRRINLITGNEDRRYRIPMPVEARRGWLVHFDGTHVYLIWSFSDGSAIVKIEPISREIVGSYPRFNTEFPFYVGNLVLVGSEFWIGINNFLDNRIAKFDHTRSPPSVQHRNPVAFSRGLAWDGAHFWVRDQESDTFCKLQLEGL